MTDDININVCDILFNRIRRDDYIRCRKRGMTDKQIAECFGRDLTYVQNMANSWGLRQPKYKRKKRGACHESTPIT